MNKQQQEILNKIKCLEELRNSIENEILEEGEFIDVQELRGYIYNV